MPVYTVAGTSLFVAYLMILSIAYIPKNRWLMNNELKNVGEIIMAWSMALSCHLPGGSQWVKVWRTAVRVVGLWREIWTWVFPEYEGMTSFVNMQANLSSAESCHWTGSLHELKILCSFFKCFPIVISNLPYSIYFTWCKLSSFSN
jgi:hypothetical protein